MSGAMAQCGQLLGRWSGARIELLPWVARWGTARTRASWGGRGAGGTLFCGSSSAWALVSCLPRGVVGASTCGSKMDLYETRRRRWRTPPTLTKKAKVRGMVHAARRWSSECPAAASFIAAQALPIDSLLRAQATCTPTHAHLYILCGHVLLTPKARPGMTGDQGGLR